ncbi:glycosyltransferase family 4 protein [Acuticoccus sp. M5D2P5]|uniref:glycosyltransferase family 4 protein n=1 Tax=Acuticoccus kalidii TaxID=2910977 RepID=UPI001F17C6C2|nr:glycosyltransferase family 1 protein [Acuticoccus kalidii]MCF3934263.1 glycosyltransferase family 4 protein [Acuticoccus kalidii]
MRRPVLFLDVSRLVRRYEHFGGPTGIDRIDLMYARWAGTQTAFTVRPVTRWSHRLVMLRDGALEHVLATLEARWTSGRPPQFGRAGRSPLRFGAERVAGRTRHLSLLRGAKALDADGAPNVTLNVSHDGLDDAARFADLPGPFAALLHDLIPITHPEYETARASALHERRLHTLAAHADHVFTVSAATQSVLHALYPDADFGSSVVHVAPGLVKTDDPIIPDRPTFVHLSSVERRKNLAMLLHVWRDIVAREPDPPHLMVIGKRGGDGTAIDLIERCDALQPHVTATGGLSDTDVARHLAGARALLTPSFVEGFGLPIVEAHVMGVPVIASDIAPHREIGGPSTLFLSPLDGLGWREAILAYARDPALVAEKAAAIVPPQGWDAHFEAVTDTLLALASR